MKFFLITFFGMFLGRKIGWFLSKVILYRIPVFIFLILSAAWGFMISYLIYTLIVNLEPNIVIQIIFGYMLGAYVAIPNYGLYNDYLIPDEKKLHHMIVSSIPIIIYIISSIVLPFM